MDIKVEFDEPELARFIKGEGPLLFEVTWEDNGIHYPMENWSDFGFDILGWWVTTIVQLLEGSDQDEFLFKDGPYSVKVKYDRETNRVELSPDGLDVVWNMQINELIEKLIQALNKAREELAKRRIGEKEQEFLKQYSAILRGYL